jgi:hypothetical protein
MTRFVILLALLSANDGSLAFAGEKWLYVSRNLQVDRSVDEIAELLRRGEAAGYTHML